MSEFVYFEGHPVTPAARDAILSRRADEAKAVKAEQRKAKAVFASGDNADLAIEAAKDLDPTVKGSDVLEAEATAEAVAEIAQTPEPAEEAPDPDAAETFPDADAAEASPEPDSGDELGGEG